MAQSIKELFPRPLPALSTPLPEPVMRQETHTEASEGAEGSCLICRGPGKGRGHGSLKGRSEGSREAHKTQPQRQIRMENAREPHQGSARLWVWGLGSGCPVPVLARPLLRPLHLLHSFQLPLTPRCVTAEGKKSPKPYTQEARLELFLEMQKT